MTGLWPFYETTDDQMIQGMIQKGQHPSIDPVYHRQDGSSSNDNNKILTKIMEGCWHDDPKQRYNISTTVAMLKTAMMNNNNGTVL